MLRRGWAGRSRRCRGLGSVGEGRSLTGALAVVSDRPDASLRALGDALWGISGVIPDRSLDAWNDAAGPTQADALDLLDRASVSLSATRHRTE